MSDDRSTNGSISGDWNAWQAKNQPVDEKGTSGSEIVNTFLGHIRKWGTHATEVMFNQLGLSPAQQHAYRCPKVASYCHHHSIGVLRGHLEEAKILYAEEERRKQELARRQKATADSVMEAAHQAARREKNAKRNAKKRAAKRRIKLDKMKTEMNDKLALAKLKRADCDNLIRKGMQHTVEGRKLMLKWANDATTLTQEAAALSEKVLAATNAEVARTLPHMKPIVECVDEMVDKIVDDADDSYDSDDMYDWTRIDHNGGHDTWFGNVQCGNLQSYGGRCDSSAQATVPVTVHGSQAGASRTQKRNAMKKLKKRITQGAM